MKGKRAPALNHHISTLPVGYTAYSNDGCRCEGCRAGNTAYQKELRAAYKSRPDIYPVPHGTYGGYTNYSCRCAECRAAATAAARRYRETGRYRKAGS